MKIDNSVALVTGANRGLGAKLVEQLVRRGARRVYAAARRLDTLRPAVAAHPDIVVPVELDITDAAAVAAAARQAGDVNLLINNAGVLAFGSVLDVDLSLVERDLATNYVGTLQTVRGFVPVIEANGGGAVVNILTLVALSPMPGMAAYCASKAAADSMTRAMRAELAGRGIAVHGVYPAGIDTDMLAGVDGPKADPAQVAQHIVDGITTGAEDITPDPISEAGWQTWLHDAKALDRQFAESLRR